MADTTNDMKQNDPSLSDLRSSLTNGIKGILGEHLSKVREISSEWDTLLNNKTLEINHLKDTVRELRAMKGSGGGKQSQVLQEGIDAYIAKRTQHLQQSLAGAISERDEANKRLEEEKKGRKAAQALAKEFKSKSEELTAIIAKMESCDNYDVNSINDEIVAERDRLQRMYNELKVKYERNSFEFDQHFRDKLNSICSTVSTAAEPIANMNGVSRTRMRWGKDLDELDLIYQQQLNQSELEWERAKNKSIKALDDEYKRLEDRIKERLQLSLKEREESIKTLNDEYQHLEDRIKDRLQVSYEERDELKQQMAPDDNQTFEIKWPKLPNMPSSNEIAKYPQTDVIIFVVICIFFLGTMLQ